MCVHVRSQGQSKVFSCILEGCFQQHMPHLFLRTTRNQWFIKVLLTCCCCQVPFRKGGKGDNSKGGGWGSAPFTLVERHSKLFMRWNRYMPMRKRIEKPLTDHHESTAASWRPPSRTSIGCTLVAHDDATPRATGTLLLALQPPPLWLKNTSGRCF